MVTNLSTTALLLVITCAGTVGSAMSSGEYSKCPVLVSGDSCSSPDLGAILDADDCEVHVTAWNSQIAALSFYAPYDSLRVLRLGEHSLVWDLFVSSRQDLHSLLVKLQV